MSQWKDKSYYEILRIAETATPEEVKAAYHDIARVYHPDSNFFDEILEGISPKAAPQPKDDDFFHLLTEAYATLRNAKKREIYDRKLREKRGESVVDERPAAAPPAAPRPGTMKPPPAPGQPMEAAGDLRASKGEGSGHHSRDPLKSARTSSPATRERKGFFGKIFG